jgi:single-stranded DNA-binding protein
MTEASVSFAGNLTDDPELRHTTNGTAQATLTALSGLCVAVGDAWAGWS